MGASVIGIISVLALRETARQPLPGSGPCVGSHEEAMRVIRDHQRVQIDRKHLALVRERA